MVNRLLYMPQTNVLFAKTASGNLISIEQVDKSNKQKYYCCNCNNELIARKGRIRSHHFAHKSETTCSYESYIHNLGKEVFYQQYSDCLKDKIPFYLEYKVEKTCNSCKDFKPVQTTCRLEDESHLFDLTEIFDQICTEKKYDDYIADILLTSSKTNDVLFIEFNVTHSCEPNKLNSGNRIIEFTLQSELDTMAFKSKLILLDFKNVKFYNFKYRHIRNKFINKEECSKIFDVFLISDNNKSAMIKDLKVKDITENINKHPYQYYQRIEEFPDDFIDGLQETSNLNNQFAKEGYKIRNCLVCRFCALNLYSRSPNIIYCMRNKNPIVGNLNSVAAECNKFWMKDYT